MGQLAAIGRQKYLKISLKSPFSGIKYASSPLNTYVSSY